MRRLLLTAILAAAVCIDAFAQQPPATSAVSGSMPLKMTGTCESRNKSDNGTFIVEGRATDLVWQGKRFLTGTVELTTENRGVVDNTKAEFSEDGSFTVWYGGCKDVYSLYDLEYYGYFMYE